jgi:hypothetical protein
MNTKIVGGKLQYKGSLGGRRLRGVVYKIDFRKKWGDTVWPGFHKFK